MIKMYKKLISSLMIIIATLILLFPNTNFAVVKGEKFTELNIEHLYQMKPSEINCIKNNEKIELIYPLSTVPALV